MSARDPHDDQELAAAFAEAARVRQPSRFETARAARELDVLLDVQADREERRSRRGWRTTVVASAVALAAVGGVAGGIALRPRDDAGSAQLAVQAAPQPTGAAAAVVPEPPSAVHSPPDLSPPGLSPPDLAAEGSLVGSAAPSMAAPPAALSSAALPAPALAGASQPVRRAEAGWRATADALSARGDDAAAARLLAQALLSDDTAAPALLAALRRAPAALDRVDATLAASSRAEPMRVRCELRLLFRRDRGALDACRAFAQHFPEHPGARVLSFAAGRVAEDELADLGAAEAEYGRALLLSPLAGLPSTDALLARARVRAARGVLDEARADLRLYLHQEPAASADPAVRALMTRLGVEKQN